jgi:hypothetical protein
MWSVRDAFPAADGKQTLHRVRGPEQPSLGRSATGCLERRRALSVTLTCGKGEAPDSVQVSTPPKGESMWQSECRGCRRAIQSEHRQATYLRASRPGPQDRRRPLSMQAGFPLGPENVQGSPCFRSYAGHFWIPGRGSELPLHQAGLLLRWKLQPQMIVS